MSFSGGNFTLTDGTRTGAAICQEQKAAGLDVKADLMDNIHNDIVGGLNLTLLKNGTNTPTADLPMGTYKHTGVGNGSARDQYAAVNQIQDGGLIYATSGGAAGYQTLTFAPAFTSYVTGTIVRFKAGYTNNTTLVLDINGLGPKDVFSNKTGAALAGNEVIAGRMYEAVYDGAQFLLLNPSEEWQTFTPSLAVNSGSVSFGSTVARYIRIGKKIEFQLYSLMTYSSGSPSYVSFNLPVAASSTTSAFGSVIMPAGGPGDPTNSPGYLTLTSTTAARCNRASLYSMSYTGSLYCFGQYEIS
jgi:hypothetical protein